MHYFCTPTEEISMKRLVFLLALLAVLMMASCTSTDQKLRSMIPSDAVGVVKIDLPSILDKAGIKNGEDKDASLAIPSALKAVIDQANANIDDDLNIIGDVVNYLPESGIDVNSNCYIFLSRGALQVVALLPLDDEDRAKEVVGKIAHGKMKQMRGVDFVSHLDYAFAINDDVLMVARKINATDDEASAAAKHIFDNPKSSLLENEDVARAIDAQDCDIAVYVDAKGVPLFFENLNLGTAMGGFSPAALFDGLGIKAITATVNFDVSNREDEKAEIATDFICASNGLYGMFYDKVVATAASGDGTSALEKLPGDFGTYFSLRLNGSALIKMPGVSKVLEALPLQGIDCSHIISSLDGTIVCGLEKIDEGDYNFGISAQATSPGAVIDEIVGFAARHGQPPVFNANGEYQYDTSDGSKALVMDNTNEVVYLRCVNYVPTSSASEWLPLADTMKSSTATLFRLVRVGDSHEGNLCWGLRNKTHGEGFYFTEDPNENIVISAMKIFCWKEPGGMGDEEIGLSDY